jgi:predicted nucleic acid-binding protein
MAEKLNQKQTVDLKELLMSEVIQSEALINLLDKKGIITKQELLKEMKRVQATLPKSERTVKG